MTPQVAAALEKSIVKWKRNAKAKSPQDVSIHASDCPLCLMFHYHFVKKSHQEEIIAKEDLCKGCPVKEQTGIHGCIGTPHAAVDAYIYELQRDKDFDKGINRELCLAEVKFLESLREDTK